MSSPGQIPPNIIRGAGTVSRAQIIQEQQQQQEQARIDAAQRAQALKEQQAQEQADRAKQRTIVTRRVVVDDSAGIAPAQTEQDTALDDFAVFKDFEKNNPNANLNSLNITRNAAGDITAINGTLFNQNTGVTPIKGTVTPSQGGQTISFEVEQPVLPTSPAPSSTSESDIVNSVAAKANLYGSGTQFGYSISKDAQGNITGFNSTVFPKPGVQQSPQDLSLAYAAFKENQIIRAQNAGAPSAYGLTNGDISALKGAGITDVLPYASKPNVHYTVNLEDRLSGGPYRYQVDLNDSLSGVKPVSSPTPRTATAGTEPNLLEGFIAGGGNYGADIPKNFEALYQESPLGQKKTVNFAPSVEGAFMGAIGKAGQDVSQGKPVTLGQDLGEIGKQIGESPGYATGSLVGSAAFFAATAGIGELPGLAVKGIRGLVSLGRAASVERDIIPAIQKGLGPEGKIGIDADKIVSIGTEGAPTKVSVFRETTIGPLKQPAQEVFHSYPLEAPKVAGKINPDLIFGKPERVTSYSQTFVKIGDKEIPLSAVKKGPSPILEQTEIPKGYIQSQAPEVIKGSNIFDIEKGAQGENLFIKTQPYEKIVGTSETVKNTELANFVNNDVNVKKLIGSYNKDLTRIAPSGKPPSTPLKFESQPQAITAEQVKANFSLPTGGGPTTALNKGISAGVAKSLGSFGRQQASNRGVSLGLGGVTGAERKQSKGLVEDVTTEILRTPKSSTKSIAEQFTGQFSTPSTKTTSKSLTESLSNLGQFPKIDMGQSQSEKNLTAVLPNLGLNQNLSNKSIIDQLSKTIEMPAVASVTKTSLELSTKQDFAFERTPIPKMEIPNMRFFSFEFPFSMNPTPKKKKGKKKEPKYGERAFKRTDIVANSVGGEIARLLNQAVGKVE